MYVPSCAVAAESSRLCFRNHITAELGQVEISPVVAEASVLGLERPECGAGSGHWVGQRWAELLFREVALSARDRERPGCAVHSASAAVLSVSAVIAGLVASVFPGRPAAVVAEAVGRAAAAQRQKAAAEEAEGCLRDDCEVSGDGGVS